MIPFYFADRITGIVGAVGRASIVSAKRTEDIKTGRGYIEMIMQYKPKDREKVAGMTKPGNYILTKGLAGAEVYGIMTATQLVAAGRIEIYAEDIGMDIINQVAPAFVASSPKTIVEYIALFTRLFTIRVNEVAGLTRTLEWEGDSTVAERLTSIANSFDAELAFDAEIDGLEVTAIYLDIYKRRGRNVAKPLRIGREIKEVTIERAADKVATAILATGRDGLTLAGMTYDDGDIYLDVNTHAIISRTAEAEWSHQWVTPLSGNELLRLFEVDTASQKVLLSQAVQKLKTIRNATKTYKATVNYLPANLRLGDIVRIVSEADGFAAETRLVKLTIEKTTGRIEADLDDIKEVEK